MKIFDKVSQHHEFMSWKEGNRRGHVLNCKGKTARLHRADCPHFTGFSDGTPFTGPGKVKVVSTSSLELRGWAKNNGYRIERCSDC